MKKIACTFLAMVLLLSLAACRKPAPVESAKPNEAKLDAHWYDSNGFVHVNVACPQSLATLEPLAQTSGVYTQCLWDMIYDHLIDNNYDGTYSPRLAETWEHNDDGTEWTFHLIDGVEFSNGTVCDANDVACTMQRYLDKKGTTYNVAGIWALLTGYEVVDDLTIKLFFEKTYGTALQDFASAVIISDEDYARYGDDYFTVGHCYGTGKWILEDFTESQSITLRINENYRDGVTTNVQKFTLNFVTENSSIVTGLLAGDFDDATRIATNLVSMLDGDNNLNVQTVPSTSILMIGLQCGEGSPFNDENVRRAFYYAINRQILCDAILVGSIPTAQYLPEGTLGYIEKNKPVYDPEKAKQLLAESSYNGELIDIQINSGLPSADDVFVSICDMLAAVGFNATYSKVETAYLGEIRKTGEFTAYAITDNISIDNARGLQTRFGNPGQHHNLANQELYDAIEKLAATINETTRKELLEICNNYIYESCGPCCPVLCYSFNNCTRNGLKGVQYTALGGYLYNDIYIE